MLLNEWKEEGRLIMWYLIQGENSEVNKYECTCTYIGYAAP